MKFPDTKCWFSQSVSRIFNHAATQKSLRDAFSQATTIFIGDLVLAAKGSDLLGMTCTNEWIFLLPIT